MWRARLEKYDRSAVVAVVEIPNPAQVVVYEGWGYRLMASVVAARTATYRECTPDDFYVVPCS